VAISVPHVSNTVGVLAVSVQDNRGSSNNLAISRIVRCLCARQSRFFEQFSHFPHCSLCLSILRPLLSRVHVSFVTQMKSIKSSINSFFDDLALTFDTTDTTIGRRTGKRHTNTHRHTRNSYSVASKTSNYLLQYMKHFLSYPMYLLSRRLQKRISFTHSSSCLSRP
jgi:hypothetical protein